VQEYDPVADKWVKKADMPTVRCLHSTSAVNGKIYVIGGLDARNAVLSTVEEYDLVVDKWVKKADMPTARYTLSTSAVNGKIYAIGGWAPWDSLSTVGEYEPEAGESVNFKGKLPTTWGDVRTVINK